MISSETQTYVAPVDSSVMLQCRADGSPPPLVTWHKDGQPLVESVRQRVLSSGSLQITFVQPTDSGRYTCTAANAAGTVSIEMRLTVQSKVQSSDCVLTPRISHTQCVCNIVVFCSPSHHPGWRAGGSSGGKQPGPACVCSRRIPSAQPLLGEGRNSAE